VMFLLKRSQFATGVYFGTARSEAQHQK